MNEKNVDKFHLS